MPPTSLTYRPMQTSCLQLGSREWKIADEERPETIHGACISNLYGAGSMFFLSVCGGDEDDSTGFVNRINHQLRQSLVAWPHDVVLID